MGEGRPLAYALESLERGVQAVPIAVNPATASLYIANPLSGSRDGVALLDASADGRRSASERLREALDSAARGIHW